MWRSGPTSRSSSPASQSSKVLDVDSFRLPPDPKERYIAFESQRAREFRLQSRAFEEATRVKLPEFTFEEELQLDSEHSFPYLKYVRDLSPRYEHLRALCADQRNHISSLQFRLCKENVLSERSMKAQSRDEIRRQRLAEVLSEIRRQQLAKTLSEIRRQQALVSENSSESDSEIFLLSDKDRELKVEQGWNECVERRRKDIQNQVLQPPDRYTSLMVISEGLDTHIIESLGCLFDVDPECFVGHITGLSYGGVIAPRPEKWHTSDQSRSHLSLEWYSVWTVENTHFESEEQDDPIVDPPHSLYKTNENQPVPIVLRPWTFFRDSQIPTFKEVNTANETRRKGKPNSSPVPDFEIRSDDESALFSGSSTFAASNKLSGSDQPNENNLKGQVSLHQTTFETLCQSLREKNLGSGDEEGNLRTLCVEAVRKILEPDTNVLLFEFNERLDFINRRLVSSKSLEANIAIFRSNLTQLREIIVLVIGSLLSLEEALQRGIESDSRQESSVFEGSRSLGLARVPSLLASGLNRGLGSLNVTDHPARSSLYVRAVETRDRIETTFSAFMSAISIHESERAVKEAEGVTRLTELAFFFIPLTFATSVFGMEIKSLEPLFTLSNWIVICASMMSVLYILRFSIRSTALQRAGAALVEDVRRSSSIRTGMATSNRSILRYIFYHLPKRAFRKTEIHRSILYTVISPSLRNIFVYSSVIGFTLVFTVGNYLPNGIKLLLGLLCASIGIAILSHNLYGLSGFLEASPTETIIRLQQERQLGRRKIAQQLKAIVLIAIFFLLNPIGLFMTLSVVSIALTWTIGNDMELPYKIIITVTASTVGVLYPASILYSENISNLFGLSDVLWERQDREARGDSSSV